MESSDRYNSWGNTELTSQHRAKHIPNFDSQQLIIERWVLIVKPTLYSAFDSIPLYASSTLSPFTGTHAVDYAFHAEAFQILNTRGLRLDFVPLNVC